MNKIVILFFCLITISIHAQQFRYGAHVSPELSWWTVHGDLYESTGNKFGVQVGIIADQTIGSSERFALSTGLNWNLAPGGFQTSSTGQNQGDFKVWNYGVQSLDVPITIRLRSDQLNKTVLYVQYGVTLGFTLHTNVTDDNGQQAGGGFDYENMNTSLTMSAGIEHAISDKTSLLIGAYFQNGIKNMLIDNANDDNMFPQKVGLRLGILL